MSCNECKGETFGAFGGTYCVNCGFIKKNNEHFHKLSKEISHSQRLLERSDTGRENPNEAKHNWLCKELNSTYVSKNRDYGNSFSKTFDEFGFTMSAVRLQDKLERFKRLISTTTQEVKDESIRDTLMDLANYALMTVMEIDKNEK